MDTEALGRRIRAQRKVLGLNQTQLAAKAGVSQGTISDYERGRFDEPAAEPILRIAIALQIDPIWLMFAEGMPTSSVASTEQEANLIGLFKHLDERGKAWILGAARGAVEQMPEPSPADPFKQAGRVIEGQLVPPTLHSPATRYLSRKGDKPQ